MQLFPAATTAAEGVSAVYIYVKCQVLSCFALPVRIMAFCFVEGSLDCIYLGNLKDKMSDECQVLALGHIRARASFCLLPKFTRKRHHTF